MVRALVAASVISVASAASSVVSLYNIGDTKNVVASVISADKTATAYSIACATLNGDSCGMPVGATVTQGPSTWVYTVVFPESPVATLSASCSLDLAKDSASCTTIVPPGLNDPPGKVVAVTSGIKKDFSPVTVTAGLEKLSASAPAETGSVTKTSTASVSGSQAAPSSSSSHGAAPAMTQQAVLVGVAAAAAALVL